MPGFINNGLPQIPALVANGLMNVDTQKASGENPESGAVNLLTLALVLQNLGVTVDKTTVAGTRYYSNVVIGQQEQFTGIAVKIGGTGGTDNWLVELHNAAGTLVATSALAGALVGTAGTWQYFAFTAPYLAPAGTYFLAVQSNGTTAKLAVLDNSKLGGAGVLSGSATGTFGTSASITPPTTYTADLAPAAILYQ